MEEYVSNSNKSKMEQKAAPEEKKKMEKVVSGAVKAKKKNELTKFTDVFISEDARNVKDYLLLDIFVPALKNVVFDLVTNGLNFVLHGKNATSSRSMGVSKIAYNKFYNGGRETFSRQESAPRERRGALDYDDIIIKNRGDAEIVLDTMAAAIEKYGHVSVLDLYDMMELDDAPYTADKYGWVDISSAKVVPARGGGYMLKLPRAVPLD